MGQYSLLIYAEEKFVKLFLFRMEKRMRYPREKK